MPPARLPFFLNLPAAAISPNLLLWLPFLSAPPPSRTSTSFWSCHNAATRHQRWVIIPRELLGTSGYWQLVGYEASPGLYTAPSFPDLD